MIKIFFITLLISTTAQAANFVTVEELKSQVKTVYTESKFCSSECIAIDGVDLEISDLDEYHAPIWEKATNRVPCHAEEVQPEDAPKEKCQDLIAKSDFCPATHTPLYGMLMSETEGEGDELVAYCTKQIGVEAQATYSFKENAAKKAAKEAKLAAAKTKEQAREKMRTELNAVKSKTTFTATERDKAIKYFLLKELGED